MEQLGGVLWVYFKALIFHDWPWNGPGLIDWIFWVAWWMSFKFSDWLREIPGLLWGIRLGSRSSQEGNWGLQGVSRRYPHYLCHKFWPKVWWFSHQNLHLWQPPFLSITIPISLPHSGWRPPTLSLPPLFPVSSDNPFPIPNSSSNSSNPFFIQTRMFQAVQGLDGLIWTNEERTVLQAFLAHYESEEGVSVVILETGEGGGSPGSVSMLSEGAGLREGGDGAWCSELWGLLGEWGGCMLWEEQVSSQPSSPLLPFLAELLLPSSQV